MAWMFLVGMAGSVFALAQASTAPMPARDRVAASSPIHAWSSLGKDEQTTLAPLQGEWDALPESHRQKWRQIARRYPSMKLEEQQRLQGRMKEWVRMTPEERREARENFQVTRQLPPEKRSQAWENYQNLPDEKKLSLAATEKARKKPSIVSAPPAAKTTQPTPTIPKAHPPAGLPAKTPAIAPIHAAPQQTASGS